MNIKNPFKDLTKFELSLWILSLITVFFSYILSGEKDILTITASLIGVTALIFVAKGYVLGQILSVVFAVFYGIISFYFRYYGEMITYLCMTAPIAILSVISWMRNPYKETKEVLVYKLKKADILSVTILSFVVTVIFYFILSALGNENLLFSTISVTTSFIACYLTYLRSPYYALGYAANDIVLIILWGLASLKSISYAPMVACFIMFLINDLYGFFNWIRIEKRQSRNL